MRRRVIGRAVVAGFFAAVLLPMSYFAALGASSVWTTYQHDPARDPVDPDAGPISAIAQAWAINLDQTMYAQPLVLGNTVYAATENDTLYALNLAAGEAVLYHYPIDAPGSDPTAQGQRGALTLANGTVYVVYAGRFGDCGSYKGRVVGVRAGDSTGASLVSYSLPNTLGGGIWPAATCTWPLAIATPLLALPTAVRAL